ncbi:MAG: hypothetical protein HY774_28490 [Acidobacteria bacterium]|nr:hypothetical protein [Acidobacteriota bacterium]
MGFFRKLFGLGPKVPDWASFFSPEEYERFHQLVKEYFARAELKVSLNDGIAAVPSTKRQYGLQNLAQVCYQAEPEVWAEVITHHFQTILEAEVEGREFEEKLADFSQVAPFLAVRLYPDSYLDQIGPDKAVASIDLEGTATMLVLDLENAIRTIGADDTKPWGKSNYELIRLGLNYVREVSDVEVSDFQITDELSVKIISGDSFFASTMVLLLEEFPECLGLYGTLVGVPHRHAAILYPIQNLDVIKAVNVLIPLVRGLYNEGPGSISPNLYWYRHQKFINLPYRETRKALQFFPPAEFTDMVNRMAASECVSDE